MSDGVLCKTNCKSCVCLPIHPSPLSFPISNIVIVDIFFFRFGIYNDIRVKWLRIVDWQITVFFTSYMALYLTKNVT